MRDTQKRTRKIEVATMSQSSSFNGTRSSSPTSTNQNSQFVGELNADGTVNVRIDSTQAHNGRPNAMATALREASNRRESSASDSVASEDMSVEDYDAMKHEAEAVVVGAKGGGFVAETNESSDVAVVNGMTVINGEKTYKDINAGPRLRPGPTRLKSIPVTLNKLKEKGRYILTADDESLQEILKAGMERVSFNIGSKIISQC